MGVKSFDLECRGPTGSAGVSDAVLDSTAGRELDPDHLGLSSWQGMVLGIGCYWTIHHISAVFEVDHKGPVESHLVAVDP